MHSARLLSRLIVAGIALMMNMGCVDSPDDTERDDSPSATYDPVWSPAPRAPATPTPPWPTPSATPGQGTPATFPTPESTPCTPESEIPYDGIDQDCDGTDLTDVDQDGYPAGEAGGDDCNDLDPEVNPDMHEVPYDGVDQDCDGADLTDVDQDGYPAGEAGGDDCNDLDPDINPGADEICDHEDNDCDDLIDEEFDQDNDGHLVIEGCETENGDDCDDTWGYTYPGADEICDGRDNDCDGDVDEGFSDLDGDGIPDCLDDDQDGDGVIAAGDCDDTDPLTYPGAEELCDGKDNDCDGAVDEDFPDTDQDAVPDCRDDDIDGDGYDGTDAGGDDCDDLDSTVHPGADETCDGMDNDCDGNIDEGVQSTFFADADGDGFGDPNDTTSACSPPDGYLTDDTDCDDSSAATHPGADEICDGMDNDCDGAVDEDFPDTDQDAIPDCRDDDIDGDGYDGTDAGGDDCDDLDPAINPGADEVCDGLDNNCDDDIDGDAIDRNPYFRDTDGDEYGDPTQATLACSPPPGSVADGTDCNDEDPSVHPGAAEVCDGMDNDCDGNIDEGVQTRYYLDQDGDGYGASNVVQPACTAPAGYVPDHTDCDDRDPVTYPGADEICDEKDNDCDGVIDEGVQERFYHDGDADGYGNSNVLQLACTVPPEYVLDNTDCDDQDPITYPGADEICDEKDNDCDGVIDEGVQDTFYQDADGDGYGDPSAATLGCTVPEGFGTDATDCDDTTDITYPGAAEICDYADNDCDGDVDEGVTTHFYLDADADGFGDPNTVVDRCEPPAGHVLDNTDCDDSAPGVNPGADEVLCNGIDDDCDGTVDEGLYYERIPGYRLEPVDATNGCVIENADPPLDLACSEGLCGGTCGAASFVEYKTFAPPGLRYEMRVRVADILHNCADTLSATFHVNGTVALDFVGAGINEWVLTDPVPFTPTAAPTIFRLEENNDACCVCEGNCDPDCEPLINDLNMYIDYVEVQQVCP